MFQRYIENLGNFSGVAGSATATKEVDCDQRIYHWLALKCGGTLADETLVDMINVVAKTESLHQYTGAERNDLNLYNLMPDCGASPTSLIVCPFQLINMQSRAGDEFGSIVTGLAGKNGAPKIDKLKVEAKLAATYNGTLELLACWSPVPAGYAWDGNVLMTKRTATYALASGLNDNVRLSDYGSETCKALYGCALYMSANDITNFSFMHKATKRWNTDLKDSEIIQKMNSRRSPQANITYMFDPMYMGYGGEALEFAEGDAFKYLITTSGAANGVFLEHRWGRFTG